jgi:hypothetical protein
MFKYCGEILEVIDVYFYNNEEHYILNTSRNEIIWNWSENMISGLKELRKQKIQKLNQNEVL